ncbi:DNA repair protein RecN [Vagococcus jeotgali]|uniref:DNA repair protein RecN n=1 Tax=Vagococcus jeotgali TaxID=3109030 RepID=UPI002DD7DF75|nr:DNA repair protein RecN [Vagococcus sp. B2T-5]
MIQELTVQDFAIISNLNIPFKDGMTVLTGETGAGKSIIIDAMGLLVGGRGSSDYIRDGKERCRIEGSFYIKDTLHALQFLKERGIDITDDMVVIQREIYRSGRNNCRVNGQLVTTKFLRELGRFLVDIHGQNEHQELMQPHNHLKLLDQYATSGLHKKLKDYREKFHIYKSLNDQLINLAQNEKEQAQRIDMLMFQHNEIEAAQLIEGEEEQLIEERRKLMNFQKISESLSKAGRYLESEEISAVSLVGSAMSDMEQIEEIDTVYQDTADLLRTAYYSLQEASGNIADSLESLEMDESRLLEVDNRLDLIRQLKRKYGESVIDILNYFEDINKELSLTSVDNLSVDDLEQKLNKLKKELQVLANELTQMREVTAKSLEEAIMKQLSELYMAQTVFSVKFTKAADFLETGQDKVEFYISTNVGESLKPLAKVASGGELSRMMLALKTIFSKTQSITSIVFDEVDTGVSGRVAQAIAEKIHQIGLNSQVLCITHLPQVAAVADTQYFIKKEVKTNRTETIVQDLTKEQRVNEIARMLSGSEVTELTKEHAKELLALAKRESKKRLT